MSLLSKQKQKGVYSVYNLNFIICFLNYIFFFAIFFYVLHTGAVGMSNFLIVGLVSPKLSLNSQEPHS